MTETNTELERRLSSLFSETALAPPDETFVQGVQARIETLRWLRRLRLLFLCSGVGLSLILLGPWIAEVAIILTRASILSTLAMGHYLSTPAGMVVSGLFGVAIVFPLVRRLVTG